MIERCPICWLPSDHGVCSERCRHLAPRKRVLMKERDTLAAAIVEVVKNLRADTTICPGVLAERLTRERGVVLTARDALACLREIYFELRERGEIRFFQKGKVIPLGKKTFRGPIRLR